MTRPPAWWAAAERLAPEQVERYLFARGWVERAGADVRAAYFELDEHEVLLPLTREVGDYALRLRDVIAALERQEEKSPAELIAEISAPTADVLDLRLTSPDIGPGTIGLPDGVDVLAQAAEVVAAALASTFQQRATHRWSPPPGLDEQLGRVLIGPAEPSSFAVRLLVPTARLESAGTLGRRDLGRRTTTLLARSLELLSAGAERKQLIDAGVSAELCFAVAALMAADGRELDVRFSWSGAAPAGLPSLVRFEAGAGPGLRRLGRSLGGDPGFRLTQAELDYHVALPDAAEFGPPLELPPPREGVTVRGPVTRLVGRRYVTIRAEVDGRERTIRIDLEKRSYDVALRAHDRGKAIEVTGDLVDRPRIPVLTKARNLRVLG